MDGFWEKEFDNLIFYCSCDTIENIVRIYIIPKSEIIKIRKSITIYRNPISIRSSDAGWYGKYRIDVKTWMKGEIKYIVPKPKELLAKEGQLFRKLTNTFYDKNKKSKLRSIGFSSSGERWSTSHLEKGNDNNYDDLIIFCLSNDKCIVERIYVIPKYEIDKRKIKHISLTKNSSRVGWYEIYRLDDGLVKKINEKYQKFKDIVTYDKKLYDKCIATE